MDKKVTQRDAPYAGIVLSAAMGQEGEHLMDNLGIFPLKDERVFKRYKEQESALWSASELDFTNDVKDFARLPPNQKRAYRLVVGFFQVADAFVSAQAKNYLLEAQTPSEELFLNVQLFIEGVHQEAYGLAGLILPEASRKEMAKELMMYPCVCAKWEFIVSHRASNHSLGYRYLAGAFSEGVFFAALFAIIFLWRRENVMKMFCTANQWIMRDETIHRDFNADMVKRYGNVSTEEAHAMARMAYTIEMDHVHLLLAEPFFGSKKADEAAGLSVQTIDAYVRTLVNQVLVLAGFTTLFTEESTEQTATLPWMRDMGLIPKPNFYDTTVTTYSQFSVSAAMATATKNHDGDADDIEVDF